MFKSHKIKLIPTRSQETFFKKSCGVARFTYNWALNKWQEDYRNGIKQSAFSLIKHLNSIKREQFPWMQETGKCASQYAIHNLEHAYKRMWKEGARYPKFKKKGVKDSFISSENKEQFKQQNYKIWIPSLGWVKCHENLRFEGKVNYVAVKRIADQWFAIVNVELQQQEKSPIPSPKVNENQVTVGVDIGIKSMVVLSDGTVFQNPKALGKHKKQLARLHRRMDRKVKGSKNREKAKIKLARKYYKISCIRSSAIHKATSYIVNHYDRIVIEDLNVAGMVKNHNLARSLSDVSFGEIARQLAYKSQWQEKELVRANRFFASSKTCSSCGHKKDTLKLSERTFTCQECGTVIDRDLNAAINLANYSPTSKYEGSNASGLRSSLVEIPVSLRLKEEVEILTLHI